MTQTDKMLGEELLARLVGHFGVTHSNKDGGYILPDGSLLNLNRSNLSTKQYHREVAALLPEEMQGACDEIGIVNLMTTTGMIRYEAQGRVHVATLPTPQQRQRLFNIMKYSETDYLVLVSDKTAATIGEQKFKSPQAHELLRFFERCFGGEPKQFRADEFAIGKDGENYILTFRPGKLEVARYDSVSETFTVEPQFKGVLDMFKQRLAKIK
ncbi:hypothetical protein DI392_06455 [Vibrio albus]|uniref:Uncharacterized protein n=1 Tax=Vibrio albus TaxID=2200953 RepID=A0A2U3BAL3_9VIBR|nr:hypothetical protein [Vibrio albus]PWI33839.1 hypothetical protein DI392_06455 [Vibrio albus]